MNLDDIRKDVEYLKPDVAEVFFVDAHRRVAEAKAELKAIDALLDAALKAKLADGGRIEFEGGKYLCLGKVKKTRLLEGQAWFILNSAGKKNRALLTTGKEGILVANPFKPAAVRELVGDDVFAEAYEVTEETEVDENGGTKAKKEVKLIDPAFTGGANA